MESRATKALIYLLSLSIFMAFVGGVIYYNDKEYRYRKSLRCPENMKLLKSLESKYYCAYAPKKVEND